MSESKGTKEPRDFLPKILYLAHSNLAGVDSMPSLVKARNNQKDGYSPYILLAEHEAKIERLTKALEYYADDESGTDNCSVAREALNHASQETK